MPHAVSASSTGSAVGSEWSPKRCECERSMRIGSKSSGGASIVRRCESASSTALSRSSEMEGSGARCDAAREDWRDDDDLLEVGDLSSELFEFRLIC